MANNKQARSTKKAKPRHRGRKPRYTQSDWERLVKTGMAWELFPDGPSSFVGRVANRGIFPGGGGAPVPLEPKKDNHAARHAAKKEKRAAHEALLKKQAEEKAEREELAALEAELAAAPVVEA